MIKPGVPKMLPALPEERASQNRLGPREWIVDAKNRWRPDVAVNRMWMMFFGRGFVPEPAADFGGQGRWPTHAELLNWMAVDFRENKWDGQAGIRQIMMSATYRQEGSPAPRRS